MPQHIKVVLKGMTPSLIQEILEEYSRRNLGYPEYVNNEKLVYVFKNKYAKREGYKILSKIMGDKNNI